jgi:hypothetical protein
MEQRTNIQLSTSLNVSWKFFFIFQFSTENKTKKSPLMCRISSYDNSAQKGKKEIQTKKERTSETFLCENNFSICLQDS